MPFIISELVAVVICWHDIHEENVLAFRVEARHLHLVAGEHPPGETGKPPTVRNIAKKKAISVGLSLRHNKHRCSCEQKPKQNIQCLAKVFGPLELCDLLPHFRLQT